MVIANTQRVFDQVFGGLLLVLFWLMGGQALAQSKSCCNLQTGDWVSASSADACQAKPGHAPMVTQGSQQEMMQSMQQVMVCMQKAQQQAQEYMGMPSTPNIPGMPDMSSMTGIPNATQTSGPSSPQIADCCHVESKTWLGSMEVQACLAEPGQFPDTEQYAGEANACNNPGGGGGGASAEDIEINITNGGFENWNGDQPVGFMNFDGGEKAAEAMAQSGMDMQTVFKSSDAHTGSYSLQLKARKMQLPPQAAAHVPADMIPVMAGGVTSCGDNCANLASGTPNTDSASLSLAVSDPGQYLCGVYKGRFVGGDRLWINASVHAGNQVVGGTNSGARAMNSISTNAADWSEFKLPITMRPGKTGAEFTRATVELTLKPRGNIRDLGLGMAGKVHEGTQVNIDSVRFCGEQGITLYKPKVLGPVRTKISNSEEMDVGAQTFVNLDNDDKNDKFDIDDEGMSKDDDELIEMVLNLPVREAGFVELRMSAPGGAVKIWEDARKTSAFEHLNEKVEAPGYLDEEDGEWVKHLWVEGIKPSKSQRDIEFEFAYSQREDGPEEEPDEVTITVLGIESIEWKGKGNGIEDGDTLDPDPNWPSMFAEKSWRVFPGKRWKNDAPEDEPRNIVDVEVTLNVKPVRPVNFIFRALDVDDPSADDDEVDREDDARDNRGEAPYHWGGFPDDPKDYLTLEFDDITKTFPFRVTMQPGDNVRIVGGGDVMTLMELENDDKILSEAGPVHTIKIVDANIMEATGSVGKSRVQEHEKYTTDVLTVWRKLYLEIDSMDIVKDNEVTAEIVDIEDAGLYDDSLLNAVNIINGDNRRQQWVTINKNLFENLPDESKAYREGLVNNYRTGTMKIGEQPFNTNGNTANEFGNDKILIVHGQGGQVLGKGVKKMAVTLVDDDAFKNDDPLPPLPTNEIKPAFEPAYILPVEDKAPNSNKTAPFRLHFKDDTQKYLKGVFAEGFDNKDYDEDPAIWVVYLLNAFQGKLNEDGDGEGGLSGQTDGHKTTGRNGYGAAVFQESGRETADAYAAKNAGTGWQLPDVAPHEIAHLFGARHSDGGLMSYDEVKTTDFEPITLDKIRTRPYP